MKKIKLTHGKLEMQVRRLRATIVKLCDSSIYPASIVGGNNPYKERNDFQNGWNAGVGEIIENLKFAEENILEEDDLTPTHEDLIEDYVCFEWCNRIQGISEHCNCGVYN